MQEEEKQELESILREQTPSEITEEFLEEYMKLVRKYKRDFFTDNVKPIIINVELPQ